MRDILDELAPWLLEREPFALATVVRTWQSSPRPAGAAMAVSARGQVIGSVSGGCIEGALYELANEVLADGCARSETYRVADDDAIGVGLTCGGTIEVFVRLIDSDACESLAEVSRLITEGEPVAVLTDLTAGAPTRHAILGSDVTVDADGLGDAAADGSTLGRSVRAALQRGESGHDIRITDADESSIMVELFGPPPRMYVFGAIDFAAALCHLAKFAGYAVTVVDARAVFATRARFPDAVDVVVSWPHTFLETAPVDERTVVAVLTHDEKFDIPLLERALRSDAGYVGALGSRSTHRRRIALLAERGVTETELERLHSPIGLDLGARTPAETAVSILAEILKTARQTTGLELRDLSGPIHRDALSDNHNRVRSRSAVRC
ncbi:XshC-Cox1 family protein [Rhodococcus sp. 05-340-1]|uniref:XdhC family protein n=1 Tax=unclassified Rhodococcus (in: high G+C Gram-positive bacteria) TaxID=192944 RepID=UPI000B9A7DD8|nr:MULTISPECIES: XdhC/CoxI family protein [unclassified Rhodococcus (in: high G+C Gram-positive bacteria)]OZD64275.1 XshC-Cox1 family protein [Rhodococcus sp. 05-340-2]OZD76644.1 XshC-Cox1 family protein [Rhodococcus sp. 05-340-1]